MKRFNQLQKSYIATYLISLGILHIFLASANSTDSLVITLTIISLIPSFLSIYFLRDKKGKKWIFYSSLFFFETVPILTYPIFFSYQNFFGGISHEPSQHGFLTDYYAFFLVWNIYQLYVLILFLTLFFIFNFIFSKKNN